MNKEINLTFLPLLEGMDLPEFGGGLGGQLKNYMTALTRLNRERGKPESEKENKEMAMLNFKLTQFIFSRDHRVDEIKSKEVQEAISTKEKLFPYGIPRLMLCVDGRVLSKLFAGLHGNALRTPAGDSDEFLPKRKGKGIFLKEGGQIAKVLGEALTQRNAICEVADSHVGCAARALVAAEKAGGEVLDKGLLQDVRRKKEIGVAMHDYIKEKYGGAKELLFIQTSFDPHNGYLYMGLEQESLEDDPRVKEKGFTHDVLDQLVLENKIISTEHLVEQAELKDIFKRNYFNVDYEINYIESTSRFWKNIKAMGEEELPIIKNKIVEVFKFDRERDSKEIMQRAILLLANAYNAYLHTHDKDGNEKKYQYGEHDESVIVATYSEKGPFDRARSFSVNPENLDLSGDIYLTKNLIQNNRRAGRMSATEQRAVAKIYDGESEKYVENPIPVILFERMTSLPDGDVAAKLQAVDWSDLLEINWIAMTDEEFGNYLEEKITNIPHSLVRKINSLREKAVEIYKPGKKSTEALLDGRLVPVWILTGPDRKTLALLPFVTKGY